MLSLQKTSHKSRQLANLSAWSSLPFRDLLSVSFVQKRWEAAFGIKDMPPALFITVADSSKCPDLVQAGDAAQPATLAKRICLLKNLFGGRLTCPVFLRK